MISSLLSDKESHRKFIKRPFTFQQANSDPQTALLKLGWPLLKLSQINRLFFNPRINNIYQ